MQVGSVLRCGRGWRGYWRENGKRKATETYATKGEARAALNRELERVRLGVDSASCRIGGWRSTPRRLRRSNTRGGG